MAVEQATNQARDWTQISSLLEQLPPHAVEAEMSLLGSILIEPEMLGEVVLILRSGKDFFDRANGAIYDVMVGLFDEHNSLDIVQLNQSLTDQSDLASVGGVEYLVKLANAVPTSRNAPRYARLVREKAIIRSVIGTAGDILRDAYSKPDNAEDLLAEAETRIFSISQDASQNPAESMADLLTRVMEMIEQSSGSEMLTGVATGYRELDELTQGLQRGELLIIAGRPSMGKTSLALNIAENMALAKTAVGVFSLEMSKEQLVQRLLSSLSGVNSQNIRKGMLKSEDWDALQKACDRLYEAPLYIDDTPGLSLVQLRAKARRMVSQDSVEAIVVDYLQLMSSGYRVESRQLEIGQISRGLKAMARELGVPVICLSQLNRAPEQRDGHRPRMSDLRESGSIEQDADVIMMLHREEYYHRHDDQWLEDNLEKIGLAEILIEKQRNGPTGRVRMTWDNETTRFKDHSYQAPPGGYYEPKDAAGSSMAPAARGTSSEELPA